MGTIAAVLQVTGYLVYLWYFYRKKVRPNAASWLMFTYGTALLCFLEYENGSPMALLLLPVACAVMSVVVAVMCFRRNATDPTDRFEIVIFSFDLTLTILYVGLTLTITGNLLPEWLVGIFLVAVNLTAITCFVPLVRSTWRRPDREAAAPWLVWTVAYAYLGLATWQIDGGEHPALLLYPILNAYLHGFIGVLALRRHFQKRIYVDEQRSLFIGKSAIHGQGVHAGFSFATGDVIHRMSGKHVFRSRPQSEPNYIGIAPNVWIDPDPPFDTVNHSCNPNAAFGRGFDLVALREIAADEEVTFDYSTTEADPEWQLSCVCGADVCRKTLYAIQISFHDQPFPPPANPAMQHFWRAEKEAAKLRSAFPQLAPETGGGLSVKISKAKRRSYANASPKRKR